METISNVSSKGRSSSHNGRMRSEYAASSRRISFIQNRSDGAAPSTTAYWFVSGSSCNTLSKCVGNDVCGVTSASPSRAGNQPRKPPSPARIRAVDGNSSARCVAQNTAAGGPSATSRSGACCANRAFRNAMIGAASTVPCSPVSSAISSKISGAARAFRQQRAKRRSDRTERRRLARERMHDEYPLRLHIGSGVRARCRRDREPDDGAGNSIHGHSARVIGARGEAGRSVVAGRENWHAAAAGARWRQFDAIVAVEQQSYAIARSFRVSRPASRRGHRIRTATPIAACSGSPLRRAN